MSIKTRLHHLEEKTKGNGHVVFTYRRIERPARKGEEGPQVTGVSYNLAGEQHILQRQEAETVKELEARMKDAVLQVSGERFALALSDLVCTL